MRFPGMFFFGFPWVSQTFLGQTCGGSCAARFPRNVLRYQNLVKFMAWNTICHLGGYEIWTCLGKTCGLLDI
jgi:hypothetical protein